MILYQCCEELPSQKTNLYMKTITLNGLEYAIDTQTNTSSVIMCTSNATSISIPSSISVDGITYPVAAICDDAFAHCESLTEINIPNSIISIGDWAFRGCFSLTKIVIPDSVTCIGDSAFSFCKSLTEIIIPDSVTYIGDGAFYCCHSLKEIIIPDSVTHIGERAFKGCPIRL